MTTKISTKGQIVIPVELREKYNIKPGSSVELMDIGGEIVIIPILIKNPIDNAMGILKSKKSTRQLVTAARKEEEKYEKRKR